jgi:hypothetical protein
MEGIGIETDREEEAEADHMTAIEDQPTEIGEGRPEIQGADLLDLGIEVIRDRLIITKSGEEKEETVITAETTGIETEGLVENMDTEIEMTEEEREIIHQEIEIDQDLEEEEEINTLNLDHRLVEETTETKSQEKADLHLDGLVLIDHQGINLQFDQTIPRTKT